MLIHLVDTHNTHVAVITIALLTECPERYRNTRLSMRTGMLSTVRSRLRGRLQHRVRHKRDALWDEYTTPIELGYQI